MTLQSVLQDAKQQLDAAAGNPDRETEALRDISDRLLPVLHADNISWLAPLTSQTVYQAANSPNPEEILKNALDLLPCMPLPAVQGNFPEPLLSAHGQDGAILTRGTVTLLAGAGGAAKSRLAIHIALGMAMPGTDGTESYKLTPLNGNFFDGKHGGKVLYLTYEDEPAVVAWVGRKLATRLDRPGEVSASEALKRFHIMGMRRYPLFGPPSNGRYNVRPEKLPGFAQFVYQAHRVEPTLIVIDPALCAYVGESNAAAPVREFLDALTDVASQTGTGILLVAHSNKAARQKSDPFDPGQVGGSTHWMDGARAVLSLTVEEKGRRRLAVIKSNYGPAYISLGLTPIHPERSRAVIGFCADADGWEHGRPPKKEGAGETGNRTGASPDGLLVDPDAPPQ